MNLNSKIVDVLLNKIPDIIKSKIYLKKWEQLFQNAGEFLTSCQENKDRFDSELAIAFSEANLKEIAHELYNKPAYYLKDVLSNKLNSLLDIYELNRKDKSYFVEQFLNIIFSYIENNDRQMYQELYLGELKKELELQLQSITDKLDLITQKLGNIEEKNILTIYDIEKELYNKSKKSKLNLEQFKIDDKEAIRQISLKIENNDNIHIIGKSKEETLYLILNEIKKYSTQYKVYIIKTLEAWEKLRLNCIFNCILIPYYNEDEIHAIKNNINIFIYDEEETIINQEKIHLRKRLKKNIIQSLEEIGYNSKQAFKIFKDTNGLFAPMKRYLFDMRKINKYKVDKNHKKIIGFALLLNQWTEDCGDKELISELTGHNYDLFIDIINQYTIGENPIFIKNNERINSYRLASLYDSWEELSKLISVDMWEIFLSKLINVFADIDKSLIYSLDNNYEFPINISNTKYSEYMKNGILKSLIMKKNYISNSEKNIDNKISVTVNEIIGKVETMEQFADLSQYINDLCEIEPGLVLEFIDKNINNKEFIKLFEKNSDYMIGDYYIQYLWAIDKLLFLQNYQIEAIELLFKLDSKNIKYNTSSSPKDRLLDIFCAWMNIIPIDLDDKLSISEKLIEKYENAWYIFSGNLPNSRNHIILNINKPMYMNIEDFESVQIDKYYDFFNMYFTLCLRHCDTCNKLIELIDKMKYYEQDVQDDVTKFFEKNLYKYDDVEKLRLKNKLKEIIYENRFYNNSDWALNDKSLIIYEKLYNSVILKNKILEFKYLFKEHNDFPILNPIPFDADKSINKNDELRIEERKNKIKEFIDHQYDISELIKECDFENSNLGWYIAESFDKGVFRETTLNSLIELSPNINLRKYAGYFKHNDFLIYSNIINILVNRNIDSEVIANVLDLGFLDKRLYDIIIRLSKDINEKFWTRNLIPDSKETTEHIILFIEKSIEFGNFESSIHLIFYAKENLKSEDIYNYILRIRELNKSRKVYNVGDKYLLKESLKKAQKYALDTNDYNIILNLAQFEISVYKLIEYKNMQCYNYLIKIDPRLYAGLLNYIFKKDDKELIDKKMSETLFGLYLSTKFCPAELDGKVLYKELNHWVNKFKELLINQKQTKLIKSILGSLLAYSPVGDDGCIPCEAVRLLIEAEFDKELLSSYVMAERNKRGVHTPDAGTTEHNLALKYKNNANQIRAKYPKTAKIFDKLYESYESDSIIERKRAEDDF